VSVDGLASVLITEYYEGIKPALIFIERNTVERVRLFSSSSLFIVRIPL